MVVGWTDPEDARPHLGALLLGYYAPGGKLVYAGVPGMSTREFTDRSRRMRENAFDLRYAGEVDPNGASGNCASACWRDTTS